MRKIILALAALAAVCTTPAAAQLVISRSQTGAVGNIVTATDPSGNSAKVVLQSVTMTDATGTTVSPSVAPAASGATASGNPTPMGCDYNTTIPTFTNAQRATVQCDSRGAPHMALFLQDSTTSIGGRPDNADADAVNSASSNLRVAARNTAFNGTSWDRQRTIQGSDGTGLGVTAMATAPTSSANGAITPIVSTVVESSHILKASAGNLYRVSLTAGASAGFLLVFNATTPPVDGAVTPLVCRPVAANGTVEANFAGLPTRFSTGITAVFSTTGCFTKTASATAMIEGYVQ